MIYLLHGVALRRTCLPYVHGWMMEEVEGHDRARLGLCAVLSSLGDHGGL